MSKGNKNMVVYLYNEIVGVCLDSTKARQQRSSAKKINRDTTKIVKVLQKLPRMFDLIFKIVRFLILLR